MNTHHLRAMGLVVNEFRAIEPDFPASYGAIIFYTARHHLERGEWPTITEIADNLGITRPTMSRAIQTLSDRRLGKTKVGEERPSGARKSLGLVERVPDAQDFRVTRVTLTAKGKGLIARVSDHLAAALPA